MKNTLRMIRRTRSRFITLLAIIAIGIAFFMGVYSSSTVMDKSVDRYDDDCNLKDITIYSGYGFTEDDLQAIAETEGVKAAEGKKFVDVSATAGSDSYVTRVHSYDEDDEINSFVLVEGRLPESEDEALAEYSSGDVSYFSIGDTVTLSRPDDDLSDYLDETEVTIVGLAETPLYLDHSKETSTLSSRSLDTFLYVPEEAFTVENDLEVDIITEKGKSYDAFSDEYYDYVDTVKENLEDLAESQQDETYEDIRDEALSEWKDGLAEYKSQAADFSAEISEAEDSLNESQAEIDSGWEQVEASEAELEASEAELDETEKTKTAELDDSEAQLNDALKQVEAGLESLSPLKEQSNSLLDSREELLLSQLNLNALKTALSAYDSSLVLSDVLPSDSAYRESLASLDADWEGKTCAELITEIDGKLTEISTGLSQVESGLSSLQSSLSSYDADMITSIQKTEETLNTAVSSSDSAGISSAIETLKDQYGSLCDTAVQALEDQKTDLEAKLASVQEGRKELEASIASGRAEIEAGKQTIAETKAQLEEGQQEIDDGWAELETQKEDGQTQLDEAYQELVDAKAEIDDMEANTWTVLTRESHYASVSYQASIDQMAAIGFLFPIFFILVAGLVCMTTMSRTVSEERGEIGILRALGYSRFDCMKKYLIYAVLAAVIGEISGVIIGMAVFPAIVYNTWKLMYTLPEMVMAMDWKLYLMMDVIFLGVMVLTTAWTAGNEMREVPAQLLRPKAPKAGKRMLVERIPALWKRISFSWKVTIRNIVRDPKRFFMTIAGVAGCTALLVTGFGVRDSLSGMVSIQYDEILRYQVLAEVSELLTDDEVETLRQDLEDMDGITGVQTAHAYTSSCKDGEDTEHSVTVEIFEDDEAMNESVQPRTRQGHEELSLADGVIIDEKLSELLGVTAGDTISLTDEDGSEIEVTVGGITEMYIGHYCFMSESTYAEAAGQAASETAFLIRTEGDTEELKNELMNMEDLTSLSFADSERESVDTMIQSIGMIIVAIILASMTLAFVVLGNLIDVNIAERQREIATLKVLGFRRREVENYIFRENNVLTVIGALCGIPLGLVLHQQIMKMVETEQMMLGRKVEPLSMIISAALTIGFGLLVNLVMRGRIHRVKMVESLKSVE
jgi:putative ABC transport system permease protein